MDRFFGKIPLIHAMGVRKVRQKNSDGSFDLYFGPEAPKGKESNWVQTNPDSAWFPYFRLYSPEQAFLDQTWVLPDIEKTEGN